MTRTKAIATLWCTALAATLAAYGCGNSSTIDTSTGGSSGSAGHAGSNGAGGGIVIINTGGMTGSGGMNAGMGGMTGGMGGMGGPVDGGPAVCMNNAACTTGCNMMCRANGMNGTRACTCGNNGRLNCNTPPCITPDAGAPPPPVDAGPRPDAGLMCAGNVNNGRACMVGVSPSPCTRNAGGNMQTCTCADVIVPDAGADAAVMARYTCM
jgi:hypothetical protein